MTEIQLKNIVDRMGADPDTKTDGDETTIKDGHRISKFSKEAMEIGKDVKESLRVKVFEIFDRNAGNEAVFPTKNGSPKILTKFVDHPYSYELLPAYERGERKLPNTKAMNWEFPGVCEHKDYVRCRNKFIRPVFLVTRLIWNRNLVGILRL
jgi:hypothetical protein